MRKVISILSAAFFLATVCTIALADAVPGALLYLDARDNPAHPDAWTNLGTVGGELSGAGNPPELGEGTIAIPDLGINMPNSKFYTHKESDQCWGEEADGLELFLEDWTIEFLLRCNGAMLGRGLAGFQPIPMEGHNAIRLAFWWGEGELGGQFGGVDGRILTLEEGVWSWVAFVNKSGDPLRIYHNGELVNLLPGADFDKKTPITVVIIGANSYGERAWPFNGSIALVRVYDIALDKDQIMQNIRAWAAGEAVEPASKLTTTWGSIKGE